MYMIVCKLIQCTKRGQRTPEGHQSNLCEFISKRLYYNWGVRQKT